MVCYDMFGCPELGNWSSIWCVDVFDIGSNASTSRRRHLTDDPMTRAPPPAPAGFAALLVGGAADTSRGKVIRPRLVPAPGGGVCATTWPWTKTHRTISGA